MIAALRAAVAAVHSEMAEKNAVIRILAEHGHRRPPSVIQQRDASGVTRVYLWVDAGIALVTGPSLEGAVHVVHPVAKNATPGDFDLFIPAATGRSAYAAGRAAAPKPSRPPTPVRAPLASRPALPTPAPYTARPLRVAPQRNPASMPAPASTYDPKPPPASPVPASGISMTGTGLDGQLPFLPLDPNPVWAQGGGADAIAARLKYYGAKPGGGLAGAVYLDPQTNLKYLAKFPPDPDMVASEVVAAHLYRALGVQAPDMRPATLDGKAAILSPWIDGLKKVASSASGWTSTVPLKEALYQAASFPADVWLADYDVVGLSWDNMLWVPPDHHIIRVDPGASLMFRAGGQLKSPLPSTDAGKELTTMLLKPMGDKIPVVFAAAKLSPVLMYPMTTAISDYMKPAYLNSVGKWAGYTLTDGLQGSTFGSWLASRGQSLWEAVGALPIPSFAPPGTSLPEEAAPASSAPESLGALAKAVAAKLLAKGFDADGFESLSEATGAKSGKINVKLYKGAKGIFIIAELLPTTTKIKLTIDGSVYGLYKTGGGLVDEIASALLAMLRGRMDVEKGLTKTASVAAPAPAPVATTGHAAATIAKKVAALIGGTAGSTGDGTSTFVSLGKLEVLITEAGQHIDAVLMWNGADKQKMTYLLPTIVSLTSFYVSRAGDIANAAKALIKKEEESAYTPGFIEELEAKTAAVAGGGEQINSITELDALPEGSVVAGEDDATFNYRDDSGLWRELTTQGDMTPGVFSDDVYDSIGPNMRVLVEGSGTGPFPDDESKLTALYKQAAKVWSGDTPAATPAPAATPWTWATDAAAASAATVAPAPALTPAVTLSTAKGDPAPWPDTSGVPDALPPDPIWATSGGVNAVASRLKMAKMGQKLGSFPGGKIVDPETGSAFYVKFFKNAEHAFTESLASHLYRMLGLNAPDVRFVVASALGQHKPAGTLMALVSPWQDGYYVSGGNWTTAQNDVLRTQLAADAWMANYDVVGKGPATAWDNLLVSSLFLPPDPRAFLRVDQGAALDYRSSASAKKAPSDWGNDATNTMAAFLIKGEHPTLAKTFKGATILNNGPMINRIAALISSPAFVATLDYGDRSDLLPSLKARGKSLIKAYLDAKPAPTYAAPAPAPAPAPVAAGEQGYGILQPGAVLSGSDINAATKNVPASKKYVVVATPTNTYVGGPNSPWSPTTINGSWQTDIETLPPGQYVVVGVGAKFGQMPAQDVYKFGTTFAATYMPLAPVAPVAAPAPALTKAQLISAIKAGKKDLAGANLYNADLSTADLSTADLTGANLAYAILAYANLTTANLSDANLSGANLSGANLSGANLSGANLSGADLYNADLSGANLSGANLSGADLSGANLSGANLSGADLYNADLSGAIGFAFPGAPAPAAPVAAPTPVAAQTLPEGMKWLPLDTNFDALPNSMDALPNSMDDAGGVLLKLYGKNGETALFLHYSVMDWSGIDPDYGGYLPGSALEPSEFAEAVKASKAVLFLDYGDVSTTSKNIKTIAAAANVAPGAAAAAVSSSVAAATAATAVAATAAATGLSPVLVGALQALHAYVKNDATKLAMTNALFTSLQNKIGSGQNFWASSGMGSVFSGNGTVTQRSAYLSKLADIGLLTHSGKSNSGKKIYAATALGIKAATEWNSGYSDPALLGKAPKAPKAPKGAAAPLTSYTVGETTAYASADDVAKAKTVTSLTDVTLAPFIKEASAKVKGLTWETTLTGALVARIANVPEGYVSLKATGANAVTLTYKNTQTGAEAGKVVTVAVPDAAGTLASTIAQAAVYFLVYMNESGGKAQAQPPSDLPEPKVVDGVALVTGAMLTTQAQLSALPPGSETLNGEVRYFAFPNWNTYFKPVANIETLVEQGIVFPAPKAPGWPAAQVAPTLNVYSQLPIGTLLRTDFSGGSVYAVRLASGSYEKIQPGTGVIGSTPRTPQKLVLDASGLSSKGTLFAAYLLFLGKGKVEEGATYMEWIEGKRSDNADAAATAASAEVEILAATLGIDPRVAKLFTPKALQAMIAQKGIPYLGSSLVPPIPASAKSPLLKNPHRSGFRSNPEKYRDVVRQVLRNPRPTLRDLQDAELLEAAGLPLHDAVPRKRNPGDGSFAPGTDQEIGIIKAIADALKTALGSEAKPQSSSNVGSNIDSKLSSMYGSGGTPRPETSGSLGQYLRYLVAARALGLWKNYIDPGEREVTRGLSFEEGQANDPSQSVRVNTDGLSQIEVLKAAGLSTPTKPIAAMNAWLTAQASGKGWFRADVGQPWQASSDLAPPSSYEGKQSAGGSSNTKGSIQHWNTYQRADGGTDTKGRTWQGKLPYPSWAAEPWANVEGFCVDYHDPTFSKFTASEWSAPLFGYGGKSMFLLRANTRDPRFVLLPGSKLSGGPMVSFESEGAIVFVTVDETPLKAEVVSTGSGGHKYLTDAQLSAWIRARPAYPMGPKPVGPAAGIVVHRNPAPATGRLNTRELHAFLFPRAKWGPGAVRAWLAKRGLEGLAVAAAGNAWRVEVYGAAAFRPGSVKQRAVGDGVIALVGQPV